MLLFCVRSLLFSFLWRIRGERLRLNHPNASQILLQSRQRSLQITPRALTNAVTGADRGPTRIRRGNVDEEN